MVSSSELRIEMIQSRMEKRVKEEKALQFSHFHVVCRRDWRETMCECNLKIEEIN